jgi:two-component system KDP operon response regulator KdpE
VPFESPDGGIVVHKRLILVVDDEPAIVRLVSSRLAADGYAVKTVASGEEALAFVDKERPDLVVLDVMMPGIDGFETLRRLRAQVQVPVILLTARSGDADLARGFHAGADDYIAKPFNPDELALRVAAVLRRTAGAAPIGGSAKLVYPGVTIDLDRRTLHVNGDEVRLSKTEWELLSQLAGNVGRVMLHGELLSRIWGPEFRDEAHYLRTWISRIRAKLDPDPAAPSLITTFPGLGYRLEAPPSLDTV